MFKNKYLFVVLTFLFLALNIVLVLRSKKLSTAKHTQEESFFNQLTSMKNENAFLDNFIQTSLFDTHIPQEAKLLLKESHPELIETLNFKGKLVFFYKSDACAGCLVKIYADLEILADRIGKENIITISDALLSDDDILQPSKFNFFQIASLGTEVESMNQPFLFIINNNMDMSHVYFPELFEKDRQKYFAKLIPEFFE